MSWMFQKYYSPIAVWLDVITAHLHFLLRYPSHQLIPQLTLCGSVWKGLNSLAINKMRCFSRCIRMIWMLLEWWTVSSLCNHKSYIRGKKACVEEHDKEERRHRRKVLWWKRQDCYHYYIWDLGLRVGFFFFFLEALCFYWMGWLRMV